MTEKVVALKSSERDLAREPEDERGDYEDSAHVTLARALEEARAAREKTFELRNEVMGELERFRGAMRKELGEMRAKNRKVDARDVVAAVGLAFMSGGIAVAFHWAYSLIVVGSVLSALGVLTSRAASVPRSRQVEAR